MHIRKRFAYVLSILILAGLLMSCVPPAVAPVATVAPAPPPTATMVPPTPMPTVASSLDPALSAEIDALVTKAMTDYKLPGLAIGVIKDGEVVYTGGFGVGNVETDAPVTPQSLFVMASVSKMFTAAAIMQLVEKGLIDLNAPVIDYLPYFQVDDPLSDQITVLDLLGHTSGLPFASINTGFAWQRHGFEKPDNEAGGLERFVKSMTDVKLLVDPGGSQTLYSSVGYDVLGDIVAKVSGQEYEAYMQENILDPLGMDHSTFLLGEADAGLLTVGHRNSVIDPTVNPWPFFPFNREHGPAAGLITNVDDMTKWAMALLNGGELNGNRILAAESVQEIWSPTSTYGAGGLLQDYGMGWFLGEDQGHSFVWHPGGIPGYTSNLILAPADGVAVVTMSNFNRNTGEPEPWYATEVGTAAINKVLASMPKTSAAEPPPDMPEETSSLDPALAAEIESIVETAMTASTVPGMGVAVVQDGEIVYAQGFGVTDVETGEPVIADTPFLWAESTFAPTTFAVMQLVEQGKIDLDAPITDYLPYFQLADERYTDMTVRHILQQRSGLADSGDRMADWTTFQPQDDPGALERHVRGLADKQLLFVPGSAQEWSDVAYTILGDVIAKVSGQDFETYMQEHVLSPLGMAHSSFLLDGLDAGLMAQPHVKQAGQAVLTGHYPYHRPFGAANNLMASIEDMARLAQVSLNRGELDGVSILSDDSFTQMWGASEPTSFGDFPFGVANPTKVMEEWGLGWFVSDDAGTPLYSTFGREYGFQGQMSVAPEAGLAVMAIGNTEITGAYYASDVAVDVLRMLLAQRSEQGTKPSPEVSNLDPTVTTEIEAILNQHMTENQIPGMAMCIVKDGEVAYSRGFGVAKVGTETPVTPESVFLMASVSKSLTAVAIMQLVEQGKIDLEARVTKYLPDFTMQGTNYVGMTVHQLLNHTSGLKDDFGHDYVPTEDPMGQAVTDLADQYLAFYPGQGWIYSGVGYAVLGDIIATVSGMDYETYMQTHILEPLGMTHATFVPEKADPTLLTARHITDADGNVVVSEEMKCDPRSQAECTLHASCEDMVRFAMFNLNRGELDGRQVLSPEQFDKMISTTLPPARNASKDIYSLAATQYALGWMVGTVGDHLVFGHPGGIPGLNTHLLVAPDDGLALVVLSNWATEPDGWPASYTAIEAMYPLLGVER